MELTSTQRAALDVVQASREAADQLAHNRASRAEQNDEMLLSHSTYKNMSQVEAAKLGQLMLSVDQKRFVPFVGRSAVRLQRASQGRHKVYDRVWLPKIDIVTPLMYPTEIDHIDEVPIVTGWRAIAHTIGSDIKAALSAVSPSSPDNLERQRELVGLTLQQVVQNPESDRRHPIEREVSTEYYQLYSAYPGPREESAHPDMDADDPHYIEQFQMLRAVRAAVGK